MSRGIIQTAVETNNLRLELEYKEASSLGSSEEPEIGEEMILLGGTQSRSDEFDCLLKMI